MKTSIACTILMSQLVAITEARDTVKYTFKTDANQAEVSSYWQGDDACLDINTFSMYATDGYVKTSGSKKTIIKSINGYSTFYSNCKKTGATKTELSFYTEDPVSGLVFTPFTNVSITTTVKAYYSKSKCVIKSYDFPFPFDSVSDTDIPLGYYVCGDAYDYGKKNLTIDTVVTLPADFSAEYTTKNKGVARGRGYLFKYDSKLRCKTAEVSKNVLKFGKVTAIEIPAGDFTSATICKVKEGSTERTMFTDI